VTTSAQTLGAGTKQVDALNVGGTMGVGNVGGVVRFDDGGTNGYTFRTLNASNGFGSMSVGAIKFNGAVTTAAIYNNEQMGYVGQNNGQLVMYSQGVGFGAGTHVWRSQNGYTNGSADVLISDTALNVKVGYKLTVQGTSNDGSTVQFSVLADPSWNNARAAISPLTANNTIIPNMQTGQTWSLLDIYNNRAQPNGTPVGGTMLSLGTTTTSTSLQVGQVAFYNINGRTVNSDDMRIAYIEGATSGAKDKGEINIYTANGVNTLAKAVSISPTKNSLFFGDVAAMNAANGLVLKDTQGTPHYWRITVTTLGVLTVTDIGTTYP
jgi:hypothetical protein